MSTSIVFVPNTSPAPEKKGEICPIYTQLLTHMLRGVKRGNPIKTIFYTNYSSYKQVLTQLL